MQAVGPALRRHGLVGGRQRLPQHLSAVDVAEAEVLALAAKNVLLDLLQLQQLQQFFQNVAFSAGIHASPEVFYFSCRLKPLVECQQRQLRELVCQGDRGGEMPEVGSSQGMFYCQLLNERPSR